MSRSNFSKGLLSSRTFESLNLAISMLGEVEVPTLERK